MTTEFWMSVMGVAMFLITALGGALWVMLRAEAAEHADQLKGKADNERLQEIEVRWQAELVSVRTDNERLISKLEDRHNREVDQLATRLGEQIRSTETSILAQLQLMLKMLNKD